MVFFRRFFLTNLELGGGAPPWILSRGITEAFAPSGITNAPGSPEGFTTDEFISPVGSLRV